MPRPERPLSPQDGPVQHFAARLRQLREDAGRPAYRQMAQRAGYSSTSLSDAAGGRQLPGLAVVLAYVEACGADAGEWEQLWRDTAAQVAAQRSPSHLDSLPARPPYQGLAGFQTTDAAYFFGREQLVEELVERLTQSRFLAVTGASGIGKSSALRAGLIPAIGTEATVLTPGDHPLRHREVLASARGQLVVVDQFEEIFTLCRDEAERAAFLDLLLYLVYEPDTTTRVVLGIRADFLAGCALYPKLAAKLSEAAVFVGPMTQDQLQRAITGPATQAGVTLERALVAQVLTDTRSQPGALPLLSHAMLETWQQRRSDMLTLTGYLAAGGISGAIARTAEQIHAGLDQRQQVVLQHLMVRLTALGEGTEDTRRRVHQSELALDGADLILDQLVAARLVVVHEGAVEIAHEALIGAWPRLHQWLTEDRDALLRHRQLIEAAQLWETMGRDPSALLRGTRLAIATEWFQNPQHAQALTAGEKSFYDTSKAAELAELRAVGTQARQLKRLAIVLASMLLCVALAASMTVWQWRTAVEQTHLATSRDLASHATRISATDVSGAMRLSLEAYAAAQTADARGALLSIASRHPYDGQLVHAEPVKETAFSPDGKVLITASQDPALVVWDPARRTEIARLTGGHKSAVRALAIGPGNLVVSGGLDGAVALWDYQHAKLLKMLRKPSGSDHRLESVAISPDGHLAAASARDTPTELWHLPDGAPLGTLPDRGGIFTRVAFSPDGHRLVSAAPLSMTSPPIVTVWNVDTRTVVQRSPELEAPPQSVAFSPDGRTVAIASEQMADILLWDTVGGGLTPLKGHTQTVRQVAFNRDGTRLVSGGFDEFAIVWDVTRRLAITKLFGHSSELYTVAYSPDGHTIATGSRDRRVLLFDTPGQPFTGHINRINGLAVSPDGRLLASASKDTTVIVWDTDKRTPVKVLTAHTDKVAEVAFSPDGRLLASASDDRTFRVWDTRTWSVRTYSGAKDLALAVSFSPDGKLLAATYPALVMVIDLATGNAKYSLPRAKPRYTKAVFRDDHTLVLGGEDGTIAVHDLNDNRETILHASASAVDLSLDRSRNLLAVGTADGAVTVWNLADGTSRSLPNAHSGLVNVVRFSPDGRYLASTGADQNVDVWDVATLTLWARLIGHQYDIQGLAFSGDGSALYSGSIDQTITRWWLDPQQAIQSICASLRDSFHTAAPSSGGCS